MRIWHPLIILLFCASSASAQVAAATSTSSGAQSNAGASFSYTTPAGSNRVLMVTCAIHGTVTMSSITYNGVSMTFEGNVQDNNPDFDAEMWSTVAPATGAHNVVTTLSGSNDYVCVATPLTGVHQTIPIGDVALDGYGGSGTADSNTTICQANGLVLDVLAIDPGAGTVTINGGQTTQSGPTTSSSVKLLTTSKAGGASVSTGYSWVNDFYHWAHISACVNPVASVGGGGLMMGFPEE